MTPIVTVIFLTQDTAEESYFHFERLGITKEAVKSDDITDDKIQYVTRIHGVLVKLIVVALTDGVTGMKICNRLQPADEFIQFSDNETLGAIYNHVFRTCTTEFICLVNSNALLQKDWLAPLLNYASEVDKAALVAVPTELASCKYSGLISKEDPDKFVNVFLPGQYQLIPNHSAVVFRRELLYYVGAFSEEKQHENCILEHWQYRAMLLQYLSFYIPSRFAINTWNSLPTPEELAEKVFYLSKAPKDRYIPL